MGEINNPTQSQLLRSASALSPRTVLLNRRRFLIDGKPRQMFAGEVHYFRLKKEYWADRLDKLQASGFDTVATYMPWIWHELADGSVDLTGRTHPQRDLASFLDLCAERGLNVIARPGPFVMAELKNEGIPYRLYREPTNLRPVGWRGQPITTSTLDYLSEPFLREVRKWYADIIPILASRLATKGGPVIAVQLDNEIGMLSWAGGSPDLTDVVCQDMGAWARARYGDDVASKRIGADVNDAIAWAQALRHPSGSTLALHQDLGLYNRWRFRRYVAALRAMAEEHGVNGIPFLINIHGTSGGRGRSFPIGISQLCESYRDEPQMMSGSDIYMGPLTISNLPDLYLVNAFMAAMHDRDQPTSSLEFEAGDANYGDDLGLLNAPEGASMRARLCIAQGNRLLNYYLFSGGENPPLAGGDDGLDRIAITGQRHGFAAPVGPEGQLTPCYFADSQFVHSVRGLEPLLADSDEEHDGLAFGFVPDHFLTEYRFPDAKDRAEQIGDLERFRGAGPRDMLARNLLLAGYTFPAVNLQAGVPTAPCVVLATGTTLGAEVQRNLAEYVKNGGKLFLVGLLPDRDHDGVPCTVLADALGLRDAGRVFDGHGPKGPYWASVQATHWAAPRPDVRIGFAQLVERTDGAPLDSFLVEAGSQKPCAVHVSCGKGEAVFFGCEYASDLELFRQIMTRLGVKQRWQLDADFPGTIATSTVTPDGQRLLHLLNVAPYAVSFRLRQNGKLMFNGKKLSIAAQSGLLLPLRLKMNGGTLIESTAEVVQVTADSVTLRPTQENDRVVLETEGRITAGSGKISRHGKRVYVRLARNKNAHKPVRIAIH